MYINKNILICTYFFSTVEVKGIKTLSTNEPKPKRKFDVILRIVVESLSPKEAKLFLSSLIEYDKSIR